MSTEHVLVCGGGVEGAFFRCEHCTMNYYPTMPMRAELCAVSLRGFVLMHKHCQKPEVPSKQVPMFGPNGQTTQRYGAAMLAGLTREAQASVALDNDPDCGTRVCEGIDGSSDEPDPETDPPPPDPYFGFNANYPKATDRAALRDALHEALKPAEYALLGPESVEWHPKSGQFEAVAHWARVENAHTSHANRKPTPGITVPARHSMPHALALALAGSVEKKPKRTRKAKA